MVTMVDIRQPVEVAAQLAELNRTLARSAEVPEEVLGFVHDLAGTVADLDERELGPVDPYLLIALQKAALKAQLALGEADPERRRDLRLRIEQMRHVFRDIASEEPVSDERSGKELARWLVESVHVPQLQLAELLDVDRRTLQRWISTKEAAAPTGEDERRLRVVARVVNQLRYALTPAGVIGWFKRARPELDDRAPRSLLPEPDALPRLQALATGLRTSVA
ncbi:MAG TPA: hypothetical protein VGI73_04240 [Solirubrobacterales bacterium]|jgi:DNA-binding transcriptional regulator YiaG